MYSIGLDIGTTSVSGILQDAKTGQMLRSCTLKNDSFMETQKTWEKIQNPERLLELLHQILDELLKENLPVVSIGITGQMHGIVYLDKNGKPISELKTWQDGRGDLPYQNGLNYAEYIKAATGYQVAAGYGAVTYFYDRQNGLVPQNAVSFCTIHDLAVLQLTGAKKPLVHPSDAASFGLYDLEKNSFDQTAIEKLGLDYSVFPEVSADLAIAGTYKGIPVSVAIGDNQASFLGSVSDMSKSILINVGTGSQISCYTDRISQDKWLDCRPLLNGGYILAGASLCGGRAYAMLEKLFREIAQTVTGQKVESAYPAMTQIMNHYNNSDPLRINTLFCGTRLEPSKRGSIDNISIDNLNMAALCDGFMCGMAEELFDMYSKMKPCVSDTKTILVGSGNGIRHNPVLRKRFERIFGLPMVIPSHSEEAAFGSSLFALAAAGIYRDITSIGQLITYTKQEENLKKSS